MWTCVRADLTHWVASFLVASLCISFPDSCSLRVRYARATWASRETLKCDRGSMMMMAPFFPSSCAPEREGGRIQRVAMSWMREVLPAGERCCVDGGETSSRTSCPVVFFSTFLISGGGAGRTGTGSISHEFPFSSPSLDLCSCCRWFWF